MAIQGFGKPKYGSTFKKRNTWSIKEGDNVYRVFPPMHSFADLGRWSNYVTVHWGYYGTDPSDPTKTKGRAFRCIEQVDRRTEMVLQDCPECDWFRERDDSCKQKEARIAAEGEALGRTKAEIEEETHKQLRPLREWLRSHGPDRKHYLAVMNPEGEFGHLKISHRTKKQLDAKIKELQDKEGIDPLDLDQGVWFNIKRTGKMRDAQDVVEVIQEDVLVNGRKLKQIKLAPISEEVAKRALDEIEDLANAGAPLLTYDQIKLLTQSSGDPDEVDMVFGMSQKETSPAARALRAKSAPQAANDNVSRPVVPAANDNVVSAQSDAVKARLEQIQAKKAEAAQPVQTPSPAVDVMQLPDDEFAKFFSHTKR